MICVIKRDGRKVPFDKSKIVNAVTAAMNETGSVSLPLANYIAESVQSIQTDMSVEQIQDEVERLLMSSNYQQAAKAFILYRADRTKKRNSNSKLMKSVTEKLLATSVQNQNANVDERSFGGRKGEASNEVLRQYAIDNILSDMSKLNHLNNEIYIHDLDSYALGMHNCLSIPFDDILANGFNTRQTDVRTANSINTAFQLLAVIFQLQSLQQFGGCSATHLDWTMVPYVRKSFWKHYKDGLEFIEMRHAYSPMQQDDIACLAAEDHSNKSIEWVNYMSRKDVYKYAMDMTRRELKQAAEGMYHNLKEIG